MFASCPNTERGVRSAAVRQTAQRDTDPSIPVRLVVKTDHSCLYQPGCFCKHQVSSVMPIRREGKQPCLGLQETLSQLASLRGARRRRTGCWKRKDINDLRQLWTQMLYWQRWYEGYRVANIFLLKLIKIQSHRFPNLFLIGHEACS